MNEKGQIYDYNTRFDGFYSKFLTKNYANQHGGGAQFRYTGLDKSIGLEYQITPYKDENLNISMWEL
jgi:hypothetical protein